MGVQSSLLSFSFSETIRTASTPLPPCAMRLTPSLHERPWVRPALALLGVAWVYVAYVGTSFFFGASSHAF